MQLIFALIFFFLSFDPQAGLAAEDKKSKRQCVVLLHGLRRTSRSMAPMADALEAVGYRIMNLNYDSADRPIEDLAASVFPEVISRCHAAECARIHFVTHSMGGILLRYYLSTQSIPRLGRIVMLSPPNQGSEIVDTLGDMMLFKWYNGPAGQQLGTGPDSIVARLGAVDFPVGIITGNKPGFFDRWFSKWIPGDDDGKVSVARAKVAGMTDFLVLPYSHTFIMRKQEVMLQTRFFLQHGSFRRQ